MTTNITAQTPDYEGIPLLLLKILNPETITDPAYISESFQNIELENELNLCTMGEKYRTNSCLC